MSSAAKTLELLAYFTPARPQIGLSQMCKLARRDKATTYRHLRVLENAGFIEQDPLTKQFRLGPVVLQLAHTRETTFPRKAAAEGPVQTLADATGETAHVTVLSGDTVYALANAESRAHSTRAIVDVQTFPLHATSSGLCAVTYGAPRLTKVATERLDVFTPNTLQTAEALTSAIQTIRDTGFAYSNRSYEDDVSSIGTPLFDEYGDYAGAVAVASVSTRFNPELEASILQNLVVASREITRAWGGSIPHTIEAKWAKTLSHLQTPEPAS